MRDIKRIQPDAHYALLILGVGHTILNGVTMEWHSIIVSIIGSSTITGILIFILKKSFEKSLEVHSSKLIENNKAMVQESYRRKANMYDMQADALQLSVSLVYRLRNTLRELTNMDYDNEGGIFEAYDKAFRYHSTLSELLYEKRAVLPEETFNKLHEIKQIFAGIRSGANYIKKSRERNISDTKNISMKKEYLSESYRRLDESYLSLVKIVQEVLNIDTLK